MGSWRRRRAAGVDIRRAGGRGRQFSAVRECVSAIPAASPLTAFTRWRPPRATDDDLLTCASGSNASGRWPSGRSALDHFVPGLDPGAAARFLHREQLKMAREYDLQSCCTRRAVDDILQGVAPLPRARRHRPCLQRQPPAGGDVHRTRVRPRLRRCDDLVAGDETAELAPPFRWRRSSSRPMRRTSRPNSLAGRNEPEPRIAESLCELRASLPRLWLPRPGSRPPGFCQNLIVAALPGDRPIIIGMLHRLFLISRNDPIGAGSRLPSGKVALDQIIRTKSADFFLICIKDLSHQGIDCPPDPKVEKCAVNGYFKRDSERQAENGSRNRSLLRQPMAWKCMVAEDGRMIVTIEAESEKTP